MRGDDGTSALRAGQRSGRVRRPHEARPGAPPRLLPPPQRRYECGECTSPATPRHASGTTSRAGTASRACDDAATLCARTHSLHKVHLTASPPPSRRGPPHVRLQSGPKALVEPAQRMEATHPRDRRVRLVLVVSPVLFNALRQTFEEDGGCDRHQWAARAVRRMRLNCPAPRLARPLRRSRAIVI